MSAIGRNSTAPGVVVARFKIMGGQGEIAITVSAEANAEHHDRIILNAGIQEARRIEAKFSRYLPDSVVSRINASAGLGIPVDDVDDETAALLNFAAQLYAESGGLFDITSGVLRRAWDFRLAQIPSAESVNALRELIGWPMVEWHAEQQTVYLPKAGMELDFGGFGKEYAADRVAAVLQTLGVKSGYVNLGGDIRVIGPPQEGVWHFGIRDPRHENSMVCNVGLARGALATSGDYERYFEQDGQRYCHVLDPHSGWPVRHWRSVSVVAPLCIAAGALTTVAMLKQAEGLDFLRAQRAGFLAIDQDGHRFQEAGLEFSWSGSRSGQT